MEIREYAKCCIGRSLAVDIEKQLNGAIKIRISKTVNQ
jgi:hypothetical protein